MTSTLPPPAVQPATPPHHRSQNDAQERSIHANHPNPLQRPAPTSPGHPPQPQRNHHAKPPRSLAPPDQSPPRLSLGRILLNLVRNHRTSAIHPGSGEDGLRENKLPRLFPRYSLGYTDTHVCAHEHRPQEQMAHCGQSAWRAA